MEPLIHMVQKQQTLTQASFLELDDEGGYLAIHMCVDRGQFRATTAQATQALLLGFDCHERWDRDGGNHILQPFEGAHPNSS